jgi:hypothetical protein
MTVRVETTAALLSPCFPLARALVCVAPRHYEVRFPPRGARKRGRYRKRSGPTHDTSRPDHRRLASLCVPLARASSIPRLPRAPPTTTRSRTRVRERLRPCARARWFARESPAQAHRCAYSEQTLAPPALAHNTTAAGPCARLSASPATSRAARVFFKNVRKSLPSRRHGIHGVRARPTARRRRKTRANARNHVLEPSFTRVSPVRRQSRPEVD